MHSEARRRLRLGAAADRPPRWLAILFPFSVVGTMLGQNYLVPPAGFQGSTGVPTTGNVNSMGIQPSGPTAGQASSLASDTTSESANAPATGETTEEGTTSAAAPVESLASWGSTHLHARANYGFAYNTGIHNQPGQTTDTYTHTISPGLTLNVGPHVSFDYAAAIRFFSQRDFHDTVDHSGSMSAGARYGDWTFGLSQSVAVSDEPQVQTAAQTSEKSYSAGLSASYQWSDKLSFTTSGGTSFLWTGGNSTNVVVAGVTNIPPLADSQSYSGSEWVKYSFDEKVNGGLGVTVGYTEQTHGFSSMNEQYQARVGWRPGPKLNASLSGGIEDQQFLNTGAQDELTPIFSASVNYRLFEETTLSLGASRTSTASVFEQQISDTTQVALGVQQRLLGHLQLALGFGYNTSDYKTTTGKLTTVRSDEGTSYSAALTLPFLKHGSVGAYYQYSKNSSSAGGFGYSSSQMGATVSWVY